VPPINASISDLAEVLRILDAHVPDRQVWAFGSRVNGTAKAFSDLDLAILGETPVPADALADLKDALRESDLPFKVDVIDWATTQDHFQRLVEQQHVVLRRPGQ
jgi:type I restriction enzyme S subunit